MESQIITVECKVCGAPVNLPFVPSGNRMFDELLMGVAKGCVHDLCFQKHHQQMSREEESQRQMQRSADWRLLCPPQYQDSPEWIKTPVAQKKINQASSKKALAWEFGKRGLFLFGKTSGTGKTTTAWVICYREWMNSKFIVAMTHKDLADKATQMAKSLTPDLKRWEDLVRKADILFIDDLGKTRFKSMSGEGRASEEFLFEVIDERIKHERPTIMTANMTGAELKAAMSGDKGAYFLRRVREFFLIVEFDSNKTTNKETK